MDPSSPRTANSLTDGRATPQPNTGETDPRIRGGVDRRTVYSHNQKVVKRRLAPGENDFHYEVDLWETTPKTDYTYSRSRSYLRQPITDNYVSPNMSRKSLRGGSAQSDEHLPTFNLMNHVMGNSTSSITEEKSESCMILRSRTLSPQHQPTMAGWQSDKTFLMRNMHGTDLDEDIHGWSTVHSAHGYHGNHANNGRSRVVSDDETLFSRFSSFLVTVIWTCASMITYFPKKASTFISTEFGDQTYQSTKQQHEVIAEMTTASVSETTTAAVASHSKWSKILKASWFVSSFLVVTLPVGLVSWAIYGVITTVKALHCSSKGVWYWVTAVLHSTVARFSRVTDAAVVSRTNSLRRRYGCCCLLPLLFFLPLVFIGLLYGYSCQKDLPTMSSVTEQCSAYFSFLGIFGKDSAGWIRTDEPLAAVTPKETSNDKFKSDEGGQLAIAMLEERMRGLFLHFATDHKTEVRENQEQALAAFQSRLNRLVKLLVQRELEVERRLWNVQIGSIKSTADGDRVHTLGEQHKQMEAIKAMRVTLDSLAEKSAALSDDLKRLKMSWTQHSEAKMQPTPVEERKIVDLENHLKRLDGEFTSLKTNYDHLSLQISKWPSDEQILLLIKTRIREYFIQVMSDVDTGAAAGAQGHVDEAGRPSVDGQLPLGLWLGQRFASRDDLDGRLAAFAANVTKEVNEKILTSKDDPAKLAAAVAAIIDKSTSKVDIKEEKTVEKDLGAGTADSTLGLAAPCTLCDGTLSEADVLRLIQNELGIYDADKTGKVDYALESAGGSIISERCSETYQLRTAQTSVFGIPLWYTYNSPRVVIQPGVQPGECWPFVGSRGNMVVQLSRQIFITEVTIEHIPKILSPSGSVDSALKDFEILGLENETDVVGKLLGKFTYTSDGSSIQTFKIEEDSTSFKFVELKVSSNHGNENYTCLYRFRVHGYLDPGSA